MMAFYLLAAAIRAFPPTRLRVSTFYLGDDFNRRSMYRFLLAVRTGGIFMPLSGERSFDAVLPIVAAFACGDRASLAALSACRSGSEGAHCATRREVEL